MSLPVSLLIGVLVVIAIRLLVWLARLMVDVYAATALFMLCTQAGTRPKPVAVQKPRPSPRPHHRPWRAP